MRKLFALAMLVSAFITVPTLASAQSAQEFWAQEFAKKKQPRVRGQKVYAPFFLVREADRQAGRIVKQTARQLRPRQIRRNVERVIRAPVDATRMIFDGVDAAGRMLIKARGKNYTSFTCLQCGREQRRVHIATGFRDCKFGDVTYGWKHPSCSTPAPAGAINSLRITGPHIEKVVGRCLGNRLAPLAIADGNGPGGVNTVRCVPIAGATYHYPIKAVGDPKVDGPFYMQPDPCKGRGRNPRHSA